MKNFMICLLMTSFIANMSFAYVETECPAMRESTMRNNPKANSGSTVKAVKPIGVKAQ